MPTPPVSAASLATLRQFRLLVGIDFECDIMTGLKAWSISAVG